MTQLLFLTGMSGSGKSFWGRQLARTYHLHLVDMDVWIERHERMKIADIISQQGEAIFREIEHNALSQIIAESNTSTVIACGGGTPCFSNNMELMKQSGRVVYLKASVQFLVHTLARSYSRPLLQQGDLQANLETMLTKRKDIYEQADYIFPVENLSITNFEELIS